jgi:hypothetical protein
MSALRLLKSHASPDFISNPAPSGLSVKDGRVGVPEPPESPEAPMPDPSREEIDAKIAAAEARTDTKFARLEGKLDLVLAEASAARQEASIARDNARQESRGTRATIIGTGLATVLALGALLMSVMTYGDAIFSRGMSVRDAVKAVVQEQAAAPKQ